MSRVMRFFGRYVLDKPARANSYEQIHTNFESNTRAVLENIRKANPKEEMNHRLITHIIGIERWSQTHLREFFGDAPGEHEYDLYRPAQDTAWEALSDLFSETRQQTLALIDQLSTTDPQSTLIEHNTYGDLSAKGWLRYMATHALLESKKLK